MITKNGLIAFPRFAVGRNVSSSESGILTNIDGEPWTASLSASVLNTANTNNNMTGNSGTVMNLGLGSTAESSNDIWLDNVMLDGVDVNTIIICVSATTNPTTTNNGELIYTYSFRNTGNQDITIKELCLSYYYNSTSQKVMLARKVIPSRVVHPGELITFSYVLKFA